MSMMEKILLCAISNVGLRGSGRVWLERRRCFRETSLCTGGCLLHANRADCVASRRVSVLSGSMMWPLVQAVHTGRRLRPLLDRVIELLCGNTIVSMAVVRGQLDVNCTNVVSSLA